MYGKKQRPSWWLLVLALPMMIGLFLIEIRLPLSAIEHRLADLIILLVVYGSISLWVKANTGALIQEDLESWQAARIKSIHLERDSSAASPQSVQIVRTNWNLNRRPGRVRESIHRRLAGWPSAISGFFH